MVPKTLTPDGIQELLQIPTKGTQKLELVLQLINIDFQYPITAGLVSDGQTKYIVHFYEEAGKKIQTIKLKKIRPIVKILEAKSSITDKINILIGDLDFIIEDYIDLIGDPIFIQDYGMSDTNLKGSNVIQQQIISQEINLVQDFRETNQNKIEEEKIQVTSIKLENKSKPVIKLSLSKKNQVRNVQNTPPSMDSYIPIDSLNDIMIQWRIKARVTYKSQNLNFTKEKQSNYFNIDIIDSNNYEINCTFFNQACQQFFDKIQQGKVYEFSHGKVQRHKQHYLLNQQFQINFENSAIIKELEDDGSIPKIKLNITNFNNAHSLQVNSMTDVIGLIKDDAELKSINLKNGEIKSRKSALIFDQSGWIQIVLWGATAENTSLLKNKLICLKNIKVQEFQNTKELAAVGQTRIFQDQNLLGEIKEGFEILSWLSKVQGEVELQNESQINQEITRYCSELVDESLQNLENPRYKQVSEVRAYISYIKPNGSLYYISCTKCPKKVHQQSNIYHCNSCQIDISEPNYKYIVRGRISDTSGSMWVTFYDDHMQQILNGLECKEFIKMDGEIQESTIKKAFNQEYRLRILSKSEEYEGSLRTQNKVMKILKNNYLQETKELLDYIKIESKLLN